MSNSTLPVISCETSAFTYPSFFGTSIVSVSASLVENYTASSPLFSNPNHDAIPPVTLDFCNVTITHTHPGQNDFVQTQIWLPTKTWNGRMQAVGGGGFIAGLFGYIFIAMDAAIAEGYAAVSTNAGLYTTGINGEDADTWALLSPGNVNLFQLRNFADVSLNDMAQIGKSYLKTYYGAEPKYSYFNGCSNGGRQGYVLAQKYPNAFDGIAASAPGIFWDEWVENFWPQQLMNKRKEYPWPCEFDALSKAVIEACDKIDGVEDGILTVPDACSFDPMGMVGKNIDCPAARQNVAISQTAADIAKGIWRNEMLAGVEFQSEAAGCEADLKYAGNTSCSNGTCVGSPGSLTSNWMKIFVKKDVSWTPGFTSRKEYENFRRLSVREYQSIIGISDYDLSEFRDVGGKMITYQGTADPAISYKNTRRFYDAVKKRDSSIHDYYRLFLAPGLGHCVGGRGAYPGGTFHALVNWVENRKAPDSLEATSAPDGKNATISGVLCAYPKVAKYDGKVIRMILRVMRVPKEEQCTRHYICENRSQIKVYLIT